MAKQLTVRGVDPPLARRLQEEANRRGLSLNGTVLLLLRQATGLGGPVEKAESDPPRFHDLDHLAGAWSKEEAEAFERRLRAVRRVDQELWS